DLVCALYGTIGALSALRVREETGRGQFIDVSLFESGVSLEVWEAGRYFATGEIPAPLGSAHQTAAPYQAIRAADGFFTVGSTTPSCRSATSSGTGGIRSWATSSRSAPRSISRRLQSGGIRLARGWGSTLRRCCSRWGGRTPRSRSSRPTGCWAAHERGCGGA